MTAHTPDTIERHCDVVVVGGSAAGLAAALQLGRQRRSVIVVDSGEPRNAPAAHMHGFLGRDGTPPGELLDAGRGDVRRYGGEILRTRAERVVRRDDGRFQVFLSGGHSIVARRALAATGLVDELPAIDGLARHWGRGVIHCPFCHGYEVRDRRLVQIVTNPMGLHPIPLFRQLSDRLTVVVHDADGIDGSELDRLRASGLPVVDSRVRRVVASDDAAVAGVELDDGERLAADAVVVSPRFAAAVDAFSSLGLSTAPHPSGLGDVVTTDNAGQTSVPGLYAAGNVTDPAQQVLQAAAAGSWVGGMIAFSLAAEDGEAQASPSANRLDWDARYGSRPLWSGNPNGSVVAETGDLTPGTALDVGAGEGGDALWLAENGWRVTASDISATSLRRVRAEADRRGVDVAVLEADANALEPFGADRFDLVVAAYASIPRTPDGRAVHNVISAVAPGGTLVVVGHDPVPMRTGGHDDPGAHGDSKRPFDPDAHVGVDEFAAAVEASPDWTVEVWETRPRPPGAASSHHVDDVVLRARRRP